MLLSAIVECSIINPTIISVVNNSPDSNWIADESVRFRTTSMDDFVNMCGVNVNSTSILEPLINLSYFYEDIPEEFDARENWPECPNIGIARDQANCGSCWAFASTESFNDRLCIKSGGKFQQFLSTQDTLGCCGIKYESMGCNGGQPSGAWEYFKEVGVVSGGLYNDTESCLPYTFPPTHKHDTNIRNLESSCVQELLNLANDVQQIVNDYEESNNDKMLEDMLNSISDAIDTYGACNHSYYFSDDQCINDIYDIISVLQNLVNDVNKKDIELLYEDVILFVNKINIALNDCLSSPPDDKGNDKCVKKCISSYENNYIDDKHKSSSSYSLKGVRSIQRDLMEYGPLSVAFIVYEDFPHYKSGVYSHITGKELGGHAVKLIGWGVSEEGVNYWTIVNSWSNSWGINGVFKIKRGVDECGIESMSVDAGQV